MCVYVKDTSRSTETGSVCVCVFMSKTRVDLQRQTGVTFTDRRECVCLSERHE